MKSHQILGFLFFLFYFLHNFHTYNQRIKLHMFHLLFIAKEEYVEIKI